METDATVGVFFECLSNPDANWAGSFQTFMPALRFPTLYVDASILRRFQRTIYLVRFFEKVLRRTLTV